MAEAISASLTARVDSVRGYSAYEIARQHGYTGTEAQWLASLSGNNCTINGASHDASYNFAVHAGNVPVSSASGAQTISAKLAAMEEDISDAAEDIEALETAQAGKLASDHVYNALDKEASGYALDARQGKVLNELIALKAAQSDLTALTQTVSGKVGITQTSVSLPVSGWVSGRQSVSVSGMTADCAVIVAPAPASVSEYYGKGVYCAAQAAGSLSFGYVTQPTAAVGVNVLMLK